MCVSRKVRELLFFETRPREGDARGREGGAPPESGGDNSEVCFPRLRKRTVVFPLAWRVTTMSDRYGLCDLYDLYDLYDLCDLCYLYGRRMVVTDLLEIYGWLVQHACLPTVVCLMTSNTLDFGRPRPNDDKLMIVMW